MPNCAKEMNWMTPNITGKNSNDVKKMALLYLAISHNIAMRVWACVCVLAHMTIKQSNLFVGSFICDTSLFCHICRISISMRICAYTYFLFCSLSHSLSLSSSVRTLKSLQLSATSQNACTRGNLCSRTEQFDFWNSRDGMQEKNEKKAENKEERK